MGNSNTKRFLLSTLDWGLGHTTRIIPVIRHIQTLGHTVVFAGNEPQRNFINEVFPNIETVRLDGYKVRYSNTSWGLIPSLISQIPRLLKVIRQEHEWLLQYTKKEKIDGIISDNRYGLHNPHIPSVILTHQLQVLTGMGNMCDAIARKLHYSFLNKFNQCWVVDVADIPNLSGKLGHPATLPPHAKYIGLLSQMEASAELLTEEHILILLSGPEPQRSILSQLLWQQTQTLNRKIVFVEGSNDAPTPTHIPPHITYHKLLTHKELQPLIMRAAMVVCRSGYSTLMDLTALHKKAILIPTPYQTEQEYLGKYLHEQGIYYSTPQKDFNLTNALTQAAQFPFKDVGLGSRHEGYKGVTEEWIKTYLYPL